jgi:hypothetical protein
MDNHSVFMYYYKIDVAWAGARENFSQFIYFMMFDARIVLGTLSAQSRSNLNCTDTVEAKLVGKFFSMKVALYLLVSSWVMMSL